MNPLELAIAEIHRILDNYEYGECERDDEIIDVGVEAMERLEELTDLLAADGHD